MASIQVGRWGGAALMLGSALFIANKFNDMSRVYLNNWTSDLIDGESLLVIDAGQVALVLGLLGCYRLYAGRSSRAGRTGLLLLLAGGISLGAGHVSFTPFPELEALFLLVLLGGFLMFIGLILFGAANLRSRVLQRWQALPLQTGLTGAAGFLLFSGDQYEAVFLLLRTLFGAGLVLLGAVMWGDRWEMVGRSQIAEPVVG